MPEQKAYYRRHLPHYQPEGETFHAVFRLAGSIAVSVLDELRRERDRTGVQANGKKSGSSKLKFLRLYRRRYLERIETMLDKGTRGPFWLNNPEIAAIVDEAIRYRDGYEYDLIAHTIMPNHVHMIVTNVSQPNQFGPVGLTDCPTDKASTGSSQAAYFDYPLSNVLRKLKWNTALRANRVLGRTGAFWHPESYDHVIRDGAELDRTIRYVLMNPVKAGLCTQWRDWKWSYVKAGYVDD